MQRFRAASFLAATGVLSRTHAMVEAAIHFHDAGDFPADRQLMKQALDEAVPSLDDLPLSAVLRGQFQRIQDAAQRGAAGAELTVMLREYLNNLMTELAQPWFLMIPAAHRELYEQSRPSFGDAVGETFPDANRDIAGASRCLALEEWTASVFHVMRVLEHGLRALATNVGLEPDVMAHENWKNVIDQIEKKIRAMEGDPKSTQKIERLKELSGAAAQFRYFKDAWRNHVAHSHASYDEREAGNVWYHAKTFMQQMVAISSPGQSS